MRLLMRMLFRLVSCSITVAFAIVVQTLLWLAAAEVLLIIDEDIGIFDTVLVFAGCYARPLPLLKHLKEGGKLIFPMGPLHRQQIAVLTNELLAENNGFYKVTFHDFCYFKTIEGRYGTKLIPLIGTEEVNLPDDTEQSPKNHQGDP